MLCSTINETRMVSQSISYLHPTPACPDVEYWYWILARRLLAFDSCETTRCFVASLNDEQLPSVLFGRSRSHTQSLTAVGSRQSPKKRSPDAVIAEPNGYNKCIKYATDFRRQQHVLKRWRPTTATQCICFFFKLYCSTGPYHICTRLDHTALGPGNLGGASFPQTLKSPYLLPRQSIDRRGQSCSCFQLLTATLTLFRKHICAHTIYRLHLQSMRMCICIVLTFL
jgi:hypothetical protein